MNPSLPRPTSRPRLLCLTSRRPLPPTGYFRVLPLVAAFYRSPPPPPLAGSSCVPPLAAASRLPCPGSCRRLLPLSTHFLGYTICNSFRKAPLLIIDTQFDVPCARIVKYYPLERFVDETGKLPVEWGKAHDEKLFHYSSGVQAIMLVWEFAINLVFLDSGSHRRQSTITTPTRRPSWTCMILMAGGGGERWDN